MKNTRKSAAIWLAMTLAISTAFGNTVWGGIRPVPQTKLLSWSWSDPEENLLDGRLELTGITEEAQPSFTEVTEYLPQAIIAQVGDGEDWEEKNLQITNWTCTEYVQDEEGRWPLEGTYEFKAELEEGYELAEGVDALVVEVSVAGDQAVMLASQQLVMSVIINGEQKDIYWDGNSYSGRYYDDLKKMGIDPSYKDGCHTLTLNNVKMNYLYLGGYSNWIIKLEGDNTLDATASNKSTNALWIGEGTTVTINGDGALNVYGRNAGSGINLMGDLTIESGTINASASQSLGGVDDGRASGILIGMNGTLRVTGGNITASATRDGGNTRYGMCVRGQFIMTGGKMEVIGNDCQGLYTFGEFELSGGEMTVSTKNPGSLGFVADGTSTVIKAPGKLTVDILDVDESRMVTVENNAILTVNNKVVLEEGSKLINKGNLTVNGPVVAGNKGNIGTLENNGTISGTGSVPDSAKQKPTGITGYSEKIEAVYSENKINVQQLAHIQQPTNAGALHYELAEYTGSESKGEGTIDGSTGQLKVNKAGGFKIKVMTQASGIYQEGTPVYITLTVDKAEFPAGWDLTVKAASGVYNGAKGYQAATIKAAGIPENVEYDYQYQLSRISDSSKLPDKWKSECPKIVNVNESGQYVFVKVITDNYESKVFCSQNKTQISKCKLKAQITGSFDKVYDGTTNITEEQNLAIKLCDGNNNTPALKDVHTDQVQWAYQSADVGEHDIVAKNILLAGEQAENYELTESKVSHKGRIKPRDFASMMVSADPLTYNGTEQQPKINASVKIGLKNVRPDVVFTYSTDGVDYQKEIPGFTDAGTYLVYVKASMANFKDKVQTVTVTVKPKESSSGGNSRKYFRK